MGISLSQEINMSDHTHAHMYALQHTWLIQHTRGYMQAAWEHVYTFEYITGELYVTLLGPSWVLEECLPPDVGPDLLEKSIAAYNVPVSAICSE